MERAIKGAQAGIEPKYTDVNRFARNGYAFLAAFSFFYWSQRGLPNLPVFDVLKTKLMGLGFGGMSLLHDHLSRERRNKTDTKATQQDLPLENLVE